MGVGIDQSTNPMEKTKEKTMQQGNQEEVTGPTSTHARDEIKALVVSAQNGRAAAEVADEILEGLS